MDTDSASITLRTPIDLGSAFGFPLQSVRARREVLWGAALLLLLPGIGWLLNMGHRVVVVHHMLAGREPWPAWRGYGRLLKHGVITFSGMLYYYSPALVLGWAAWRREVTWLLLPATLLAGLATVAIPGFMTHYCLRFDPREIFDPFRALRRVGEGGRMYWQAWSFALAALALSLLGLLALGVGFLVTSVWFWQVAAFSFARAFTQRLRLAETTESR